MLNVFYLHKHILCLRTHLNFWIALHRGPRPKTPCGYAPDAVGLVAIKLLRRREWIRYQVDANPSYSSGELALGPTDAPLHLFFFAVGLLCSRLPSAPMQWGYMGTSRHVFIHSRVYTSSILPD